MSEPIILSDFAGGVQSAEQSPLNFPPDAIISGENFEIKGRGLRVRDGVSITSENSLPAGAVVAQKNIRFPGNQVSYLMAQVDYSAQGWLNKADAPYGIMDHSAVWDVGNGRMLIWGGYIEGVGLSNALLSYDPDTNAFTTLSPTGGPPAARVQHIAVYDAANERMIITHGDSATDSWELDCTTDTWSEITTSGDLPPTGRLLAGVFRTSNGTLVVMNNTGGEETDDTLWVLDPDTGVWTETTYGTGIAEDMGDFALAYDTSTDKMYCMGGAPSEVMDGSPISVFDFAGAAWSTLSEEMPVTDYITDHKAHYCSGKIVVLGGTVTVENVSDTPNRYAIVMTISTGTFTTSLLPDSVASDRLFFATCVTDAGIVIVSGGQDSTFDYRDDTYTIDTLCGAGVVGNILAVSSDNLPSSTATFEQVYDLGVGADPVSIDVLNDRAIITEIQNNNPLVFMGCRSDDGSDWAFPKHVLASIDGSYFYDISGQVCNNDSDSTADIGEIRPWGFIAVCCDVPEIEAFYLNLPDPNLGLDYETQSLGAVCEFPDSDAVTWENFQGSIDRWYQDATVYGHFEAAEAEFDAAAVECVGEVDLDDAAVVDQGGAPNMVQIPATGHPYADGNSVTIYGTTNYNATFTVANKAANTFEVESAFVVETFGPTAKVKLASYTTVKLPMTGHSYVDGETIHVEGTTNYDDIDLVVQTGSTSTNYIILTATYVPETLAGTETARKQLTLDTGNDCPDVEEGLAAVFSDEYQQIVAITDDGEADQEVRLYAAHITADVLSVRGLTAENQLLEVIHAYETSLTDIWTKALSDSMGLSLAGASVRIVVSGADISSSGNPFRITVKTSTSGNTGLEIQCTGASIVKRSGSTEDGTTTPTRITWNNGEEGFTHQVAWAATQPGTEFVSDLINYPVEMAQDYLITFDYAYTSWPWVPGAHAIWAHCISPTPGQYSGFCTGSGSTVILEIPIASGGMQTYSGTGYYIKRNTAQTSAAVSSVDEQTPSGFSYVSGISPGLRLIEAAVLHPLPTQLLVSYSLDVNAIDLSIAESFYGIRVSEWVPGSSKIYHAVSLDARQTYQIYDAGWRTIVKFDSVWKYQDALDAWQAATVNTLLGALKEGLAIAENQMTATELHAITSVQWIESGGINLGTTSSMQFAQGFLATASAYPKLYGYSAILNRLGTTGIHGYTGGTWSAGEGWTDGTLSGGVPMGQTGIIEYDGDSPFEADYSVLSEVPGYWYRIMPGGTSAGTLLRSLKYKASVQELQNIGDGQTDIALGWVVYRGSTEEILDHTVVVSDDTYTELASHEADLVASDDTPDYIYCGYITQFNSLEIIPYAGNSVVSELYMQYWNGGGWSSITVVDDTRGINLKTLSKRGKVTWTLPDDWKPCIPLVADIYRGYWVRFYVGTSLHADTAIAEVKIYGVPPSLTKHSHVQVWKDRVALISRPDAKDQIDLSRPMEEYGWWGGDSASYRIGGQDAVMSTFTAWDGLFLGKVQHWYQISGNSSADFNIQGVEAARHIPVNSNVIVMAPVTGFDDGSRFGLYAINQHGAFVTTGLHTDALRDTSRGSWVSERVNWWDQDTSAVPRIDADYLYLASGAFYPRKNWLVWSVPMITTVGGTSQTTCNRLIVYDLSMKIWLPPFTIAAASLCSVYHYNANAPGYIGGAELYAGNYSGQILRLFDPTATDDDGTDIVATFRTGPLDFGAAYIEKRARLQRLVGETTGSGTVAVYTDGGTTAASTVTFSGLTGLSGQTFASDPKSTNVPGNWHQYELTVTGPADIYGLLVDVTGIRERPGL